MRALFPQHARRAVDAVDRGHDEERGVGGAKAGPQVTDKVGVARRVEKVDFDAVVFDRRQREGHRSLMADLGVFEIGGGGAVFDPPGSGDRAGGGE